MTPPTLDDFYKTLDTKDRIIHDLAVMMLKTRYDPKTSNAYRSYVAAKAAAAKKK